VYNVVLHAFVPFETNNPSYKAFRKFTMAHWTKVWILFDITFKGQVENLGVSSTLFQRLEDFFGGDYFGIFFFHLNTISTLATSTHVCKIIN
jgi:hypothetical protein